MVLGASGTGKSSLVKAGLLPKPRADTGTRYHLLPPLRPAATPLHALATLLQPNLDVPVQEKAPHGQTTALARLIDGWTAHHPDETLLLVIDQWEEMVTLRRHEEERARFYLLVAAVFFAVLAAFAL